MPGTDNMMVLKNAAGPYTFDFQKFDSDNLNNIGPIVVVKEYCLTTLIRYL